MNSKKVFPLAFALLILATGAFAYTVTWGSAYSTGGAECAKVGRNCLTTISGNCSTRSRNNSATCSSVVGSAEVWLGSGAYYSSGDKVCAMAGRDCLNAFTLEGLQIGCATRNRHKVDALCSLNVVGSAEVWLGSGAYYSSGDKVCAMAGRCCLTAFDRDGNPMGCDVRNRHEVDALCSSSVVGDAVTWFGRGAVYSTGNDVCLGTGKPCLSAFDSDGNPLGCGVSNRHEIDAFCSTGPHCTNINPCAAPPPQCTSGACCSGGNFSPAGTVCDTQTQSVCAGAACGNDWVSQSRTRACTGNNANCTGALTGWVTTGTIQNCSAEQKCSASVPHCVADASCVTCTDDCAVAGTSRCSGSSVVHCGYFDSDPCLDETDPADGLCSFPWLCSAGACVLGCTPSPWLDVVCEGGTCGPGQMQQTRTLTGILCLFPTETRCDPAPSKCECSLGSACVPGEGENQAESQFNMQVCEKQDKEFHLVPEILCEITGTEWGPNYCSSGGNVFRSGTETKRGCRGLAPNGQCYADSSPVDELVQTCGLAGCEDGACVIACTENSDCDDFDPCTTDTCVNGGGPAAECVFTPVPNDCGALECGPSPSGCFPSCGPCPVDKPFCDAGVCKLLVASITSLTSNSPVYSDEIVEIELHISEAVSPTVKIFDDADQEIHSFSIASAASTYSFSYPLSSEPQLLEGNFKVVASIAASGLPCDVCEANLIFSVVPRPESTSIPEVGPLVVILVAVGALAIARAWKGQLV